MLQWMVYISIKTCCVSKSCKNSISQEDGYIQHILISAVLGIKFVMVLINSN